MKKILFFILFILCFGCGLRAENQIIKTIDGQFIRNGAPYYYIGTNFWYGPILGSTGLGGNRARLSYELDSLKSIGINNLRILAGADAGSVNANSVFPYLQPKVGELNDTLLVGLDYFLAELGKRDMVAVIYLNNSWDWSGGYGFYLKNAGKGDSPSAEGDGYDNYARYAAQFVRNEKAKQLFYNYVKKIVSRKNSVTGLNYKDDPTIMAWQIGNEPRSFSVEGKTDFAQFMHTTATLIKSLDPNHMVSAGSEGSVGCENDLNLYEQIHADPAYDYLTIHIWPANWHWCAKTRLWEDLVNVYQKSEQYLDAHMRIANKLNKPLVIEEFGYPRDGYLYDAGSPTECRDAFYSYILEKVVRSAKSRAFLAGCNFWGWGGKGRWTQKRWNRGDDYLCDPPHEAQGWYSVFDNDSTTIKLLKTEISKIKAE
ncbi:MAG: cellulase family glycosylhydrolase [Bacteroidaceae bacterium]